MLIVLSSYLRSTTAGWCDHRTRHCDPPSKRSFAYSRVDCFRHYWVSTFITIEKFNQPIKTQHIKNNTMFQNRISLGSRVRPKGPGPAICRVMYIYTHNFYFKDNGGLQSILDQYMK